MAEGDDRRHIYLTPVLADKADAFEEWVRSTVAPAERTIQPERVGRWQALRATDAREGVVYFAFILDGGEAEEWDIDVLLREALGDDAADRAAKLWDDMVTGEQVGSTFRALEL
jgi:hypothetical protein